MKQVDRSDLDGIWANRGIRGRFGIFRGWVIQRDQLEVYCRELQGDACDLTLRVSSSILPSSIALSNDCSTNDFGSGKVRSDGDFL